MSAAQESTTSVSVPAIERLIIQEQVETSKPTKAQDVWRFTEGNGALGSYIVGRHKQTGTTVELWQEGSGSFTFVRSSGAGVKYCSSYGNMQDEPILSAPGACKDLECGGGSTWRLGAFNAGAWGSGEARGRRLVFKCSVNTREGREAVELQLTLDGFIFLSAESFKAVAVRKGELLQLERTEAMNMIKAVDCDPTS